MIPPTRPWIAEVVAYMRSSTRPVPMTLQALRESQRQLWKQKCTICGTEPGGSTNELRLHARVRELELRIKELEEQVAASNRS